VCTVVCETAPDRGSRLLALRDEFVGRDFDPPGRWWPAQPGAVGGRDRVAGGTWCASDVRTGETALVVNRIERLDGTPSRGLLPLAALAHGADWAEAVPVAAMASFNLVLVRGSDVTVWEWDGAELRSRRLEPGLHVVTSRGTDTDDRKTRRFAPAFAVEPWLDVVTATSPSDEPSALVVRRVIGERTYATVFGQTIAARPGAVQISWSRTPWIAATWTRESFTD
jgi:hypothetical protein